jgi:hypothetical protein
MKRKWKHSQCSVYVADTESVSGGGGDGDDDGDDDEVLFNSEADAGNREEPCYHDDGSQTGNNGAAEDNGADTEYRTFMVAVAATQRANSVCPHLPEETVIEDGSPRAESESGRSRAKLKRQRQRLCTVTGTTTSRPAKQRTSLLVDRKSQSKRAPGRRRFGLAASHVEREYLSSALKRRSAVADVTGPPERGTLGRSFRHDAQKLTHFTL